MNVKWFKLTVSEIEKKLKTNAATGLSRQAARSRANNNAGQLFFLPRRSTLRIVFDILTDFSLIILILGAILSLFFEIEEYLKGISILVIIFGCLTFCAVMYFRSQRMVESLSALFYPTAKVIRNGRLFCVDYRSVVVGDVVLLEAGDVICCDARIVSADKLKVKMRVDADNYVELEKYADYIAPDGEIRAKEMANMLHGGSTVLSGNARAIVTATGKYTYLGAMTGGIPISVSTKSPKILAKMKKQFSKVNMAMLIGVLPFSIVSLLLGNMIAQRESLLSVAFLTALAISATTMSQLTCTLLKLYYTHKIKKLLTGANRAAVRSIEAFDKLASADYVFMLDGSPVTDGTMHLSAACCSEGEIRNFNALNKTAVSFSEYVSLYNTATSNMLTTGVSGVGRFSVGIKEFIKKCRVDDGSLKIRCSILSYTTGNMIDTPEKICFLDRGIKYYLNVSCSVSQLRRCNTAMFGGTPQRLSNDGIKNFERLWKNYEAAGQTPILFTLSTSDSAISDNCFLGMLVLKEGIDTNLSENIAMLDRLGCKIITFVRKDNSPKLPVQYFKTECVSKNSFLISQLPLTYKFGHIRMYSDFTDIDIIGLISFAHSKGKRVVVVGFSEDAQKIAERADGFITCSDIRPKITGYLDEEVNVSELAGLSESASCLQTVREKADCLIPRPRNGRGGLLSLISVFSELNSIYNNISDYLRYFISVQIIRLILVAFPMLFGNAILDARHILFCAYILDLFVFFAFMLRNKVRRKIGEKNYCKAVGFKDYFIGDNALIFSSVISSVLALILPNVIDFIVGGYNYKIEVMFTSLITLHLVSAISVYYNNNFKELISIYKNKLFVIEIALSLIFLTICFVFRWFGVVFFGVEGFMSLPYFAVSLIPAAVYAFVFILTSLKGQTKNNKKL